MIDKSEIITFIYEQRRIYDQLWNRVMPCGELFSDRWDKAKYLGFGEKSSIYDSSIVMGNVVVGENTWIGPNTILDGTGGKLTIGSGCDISMGVQIYTHDTVKRCVSGGIYPVEKADVSIGDFCYIAPMTLIAKGVSLGRNCVVAAQSFVKDAFDDYSIIAGVPAKKIGIVRVEDSEVWLEYF